MHAGNGWLTSSGLETLGLKRVADALKSKSKPG
jgi:hypothetical protein